MAPALVILTVMRTLYLGELACDEAFYNEVLASSNSYWCEMFTIRTWSASGSSKDVDCCGIHEAALVLQSVRRSTDKLVFPPPT